MMSESLGTTAHGSPEYHSLSRVCLQIYHHIWTVSEHLRTISLQSTYYGVWLYGKGKETARAVVGLQHEVTCNAYYIRNVEEP
jgi:hypothetical protein